MGLQYYKDVKETDEHISGLKWQILDSFSKHLLDYNERYRINKVNNVIR